jgi:Cu/Ag efflux protein CusF
MAGIAQAVKVSEQWLRNCGNAKSTQTSQDSTKAGERTRTVDIQLGKLTFYH